MANSTTFLSAERCVAELAEMVSALRDDGTPPELTERGRSILFDLLAVTTAGARTREMRTLASSWNAETGATVPFGGTTGTTVETAAQLDAIASCCLELDEGNKYAAGHPAAHVVPAAIAAVRLSPTPVDGRAFIAAVIAGYEVAARFGYALTRGEKWHTHGHWGATGSAAAAASIRGLDAREIAAAIDASSALIHVTPWAIVLGGNFTRNLWIAGSVRAGLDAARLSASGLVHNSGAIASTLGDIVGVLDYAKLTEDIGARWLTSEGYAKIHASCSYTHAAIDTVRSLRSGAPWTADDVDEVLVRTHSLAQPLFQRHPTTRLGAMFSLPFVVAAAFVADAVDSDSLTPDSAVFAAAEEFSARVRVDSTPELDALLPRRRAAEVTVVLRSGEEISAMTPNPVGDVDHFPMDYADIRAKASRLIGEKDAARLEEIVDRLPGASDVASLLL